MDPTQPLISDPIAVTVVLAAVVLVSLQLEARFAAFRALGAALVGILAAMLLSNLGVLPGLSPAYSLLSDAGVSLAIAFILLGVDVRSVVRAGPAMLAAFAIGAAGTAAGAIVGALALSEQVGPETWKLAGQYTGTYTGGSMNFAALGTALDTSADLFSAAVAADVAMTAIWMAACLAAPLLFGRGTAASTPDARRVNPFVDRDDAAAADRHGGGEPDPAGIEPARTETASTKAASTEAASTEAVSTKAVSTEAVSTEAAGPADGDTDLEAALRESGRPMTLTDVAALVTIALAAMWLAGRIAEAVPAVPAVLWLTTIALAAGQVPAVRRLAGGAMLGNYLLLMFLAAIGAQSVIANIFRVGPAIFWFAVAVIAVHGAAIFGIGRLAGLDVRTLAVASQANVGGPASAIALASARGYTDRVLPGVAVGLLGYAVGNYAGFGVALLMRGVLGP